MNWRVVLAVLTCSTVLMSASYTMLIPFLPMYLIQELGVQTSEVNWWSSIIFAVSFLISGIFAPIWGAMSDKGSRKLMALRAALFGNHLLSGLHRPDPLAIVRGSRTARSCRWLMAGSAGYFDFRHPAQEDRL